jgi:predicted extracellular nuclease
MKKIYSLLFLVFVSITTQAQVVISQVYGGGGNANATYTHDFVELFNKGNATVDISDYSIQYASATGTNWQ